MQVSDEMVEAVARIIDSGAFQEVRVTRRGMEVPTSEVILSIRRERQGAVRSTARAALSAVYPLIRDEVLREAARSVCKHCASGMPFTDDGRWHELSSAHISQCHALPILALAQEDQSR